MKKQFVLMVVTAVTLSIGFTACKKDGKVDNDTDQKAEIAMQSDDQSRVSSEVDAVANDAEISIEATTAYAGRGGDVHGLICDATVEYDSTVTDRFITITYDGSNCWGTRTRTGVITISMPLATKWKNAGAAITVNYADLKVTRVADNKSITLNGTQVFTNQSGGLLISLPIVTSITHTVTSDNMSITFDNNTQRTWKIAKQRVFTYGDGAVCTISGTHTEGNVANVAEWGMNRLGLGFTTSTVSPVVIRQNCNFRITSGEVLHTTSLYSASASFGLDAGGNPTSCPGAGNYYYKLLWAGPNGNSISAIYPY